MKKIFIAVLLVIMVAPGIINAQGCMEASSDEGVNVVGYIQTQWKYEFNGKDDDGNSLNTNSFYFNRARLGVVGNVPYDISYYVMAEFSSFKDGPYLLDAFITYKGLGQWANITMGQFKSPFGLELSTPCQSLHTINRSRVVNTLAQPFRDIGVMVTGSSDSLNLFGIERKDIIKYSFAVLNGTGLNEMDKDKYKDIAARFVFSPSDLFSIGTSYRTGKAANVDPNVATPDKHTRFGLDLSMEYKNFLLQAEYIQGTDEGRIPIDGG